MDKLKESENAHMPSSSDWNHFWNKAKPKDATTPSWSKRRILNILKPLVCLDRKALDAGCGSGFFSKYFIDQGMKVTAIDYAQSALDMTEKITDNRAHVFKIDLLNDDFSMRLPCDYRVIFSDGLLEHFDYDQQLKILKNLKSILSPDGYLVTFVPNRWSPWEIIRPFFMPGIEETPFVLKDLVGLMDAAGFKIMKQGGVNTIPMALSPDDWVGSWFGMLLYTVAKKNG